jgi:cell wall-associated NlpC family hydrolase
MKRTTIPLAGVAVIVVAALSVSLGPTAFATNDPTFPSWADVQQAQKNVATKKAEVAKLTGLISTLQNQSAAAGKAALISGENYLEAKNALDAATATESKLDSQAAAASTRATASSREAGQLAAQLARQGNGNLTIDLLLNGRISSNLLDVLGTMNKLGETSERVFAQAEQEHKIAAALSAQAAVAKTARATAAAAAANALAAANADAAAAAAKVKAQNAQQSIMTAQLSSLTGTSQSVLDQYYAGVAWEAKQAAQKKPPADDIPTGPLPGPPNTAAAATAIQFAEAQVGKPYLLGGYGPGAWDCSGLTKAAYAAAGVYIGTHSSNGQFTTMQSENRLVPLSERQPGDLLWYSDGGSRSASKYHVTLYIGNNEMIEAPYPGVNVRVAALRYGDLVPLAGRPTG